MSNNQPSTHSGTRKPLILITGVSGRIGSWVSRLLASDYQVVGMDIESPEESCGEWIETDLTDAESLAEALRKVREKYGENVASVIHLAAYYDFAGEPSPLYDELTVEGTRRLLVGLRDFAVEQFIFSSSLLVMHPCEVGERITEQSPTRAEWAYPESKLKAEQVIHETRGGIPSVILRISGVYDDDCHSIPIARQIARIYEKQAESFVFPGDSDAGNPYLHISDLAVCIRMLIEKRSELSDEELFLVAEPDVMSYADLQDELGELIHGEAWPSIRIPKAVAKAGAWAKEKMAASDEEKPFIKPWMVDLADDHYAVDVSHIRDRVGWLPKRRLVDSLPQMVSALKTNPAKWYQDQGLSVPESVGSGNVRQ